jgi:hypothetical protein
MAVALNYIGVVGNPAVLFDVRVLAGYGPAAARLGQSPLVRSLRSGTPAIAIGVPVA